MCEFVTPYLLYYSNVPVLMVGFVLAAFVLLIDIRSKTNRNIFYVISIFWLGTLNSMLQWVIHDQKWNLLLSRLSVIEFLGLLFFAYFTYAFIGKKVTIKRRIILALPFLPMVFLLFTDRNSYFVERETCSVGYGALYFYMYLVATIYMLLPIRKLFLFGKSSGDEKIKNQVAIINRGIVLMVLWVLGFVAISTVLVNLGKTWGENLLLFIPYGLLLFISALVYAITKYQFLKLRLLSTQALTYAIWILIGSIFFFVDSVTVYILVTVTLFLSVMLGIFLIRSVKNEVKRKEELQVLADKLAQANDQLRKLDNAKSEFVSIASHQLRTPLTAIRGFISLILEGSYGEISQPVRDALGKVQMSGERLIQLVEDLLSVSRIESGRLEFKFEKVQIKEVLQELYDNFILAARDKKMYLDLKLPRTKLPQVVADRTKIREVISNLIDNALKYTDKGGVTIRAEVAVSAGPKNTYYSLEENTTEQKVKKVEIAGKQVVRITISDTGVGIPEEEMPYIFGKFSRGKNTSRLHVGGTGLGLYVGQSIIWVHKGIIWAESEGLNRGAKFVLELPLEGGAEISHEPVRIGQKPTVDAKVQRRSRAKKIAK